ncbi:MAG: hypothetical protein ACH34V_09425 [Flavobacterium sp.]|uniref:hypothetical protein n=1 Tax=Flavobacterium sp. TaxID=239 RepID=UPI00378F41DE
MKAFLNFLLKNVYEPQFVDSKFVDLAFDQTVKDVNFHFPDLTKTEIRSRIVNNNNELAIFLFRLGQEIHSAELHDLKPQIHWLLKQYCSCELYFNNDVDDGFYIVHGEGSVLGSRNKIGKGFVMHQGCTIGHKKNGAGAGNVIGDNVTLYANSSIIGELNIGNNVIIGAHVLITKDIPDNTVVTIKNITY